MNDAAGSCPLAALSVLFWQLITYISLDLGSERVSTPKIEDPNIVTQIVGAIL